MKLTFDRAHVLKLLAHAEAATIRHPSLEQMVDPDYWRVDMPAERRRLLDKDAAENGGFAFSATRDDVDPAKIAPALLLVGDEGVYLMSNGDGRPDIPDGHVCYAVEANPETLNIDTWWAAKNASFGADDGVEVLDAADLRRALGEGNGPLLLDVDKDSIVILAPDPDQAGRRR